MKVFSGEITRAHSHREQDLTNSAAILVNAVAHRGNTWRWSL